MHQGSSTCSSSRSRLGASAMAGRLGEGSTPESHSTPNQPIDIDHPVSTYGRRRVGSCGGCTAVLLCHMSVCCVACAGCGFTLLRCLIYIYTTTYSPLARQRHTPPSGDPYPHRPPAPLAGMAVTMTYILHIDIYRYTSPVVSVMDSGRPLVTCAGCPLPRLVALAN